MSEQLEIFDEQGESLGLEDRDVVHRLGAWHKAVQVFVFNCVYAGEVVADPVEVAALKYVSLPALQQWVDTSPQMFTPWFVADLRMFGWLA